MGGPRQVERRWIEDFLPNAARLRCSYVRQGKEIVRFTVQLELNCDGAWRPVVRYEPPRSLSAGDAIMIDRLEFAQRQLELTGEFGKYVIDHPEVDDILPPESFIYFEVAGQEEFNRYSRELAEKQLRDEGLPIVCV